MSKDFNDQLQQDGNVTAISNAIQNAAPVERKNKKRFGSLPDGCPVTALGRRDNVFFYMDANRQLAALRARDHGRLDMAALFAPHTEWCETQWPRWSKPSKENPVPEIVGTDWAKCADALMNACANIGPIDLDKRVRAAGAWIGGDGQLMMHCGDKIFAGDQVFLPGRVGDYVYPAASLSAHPTETDGGTAAAEEVLQALQSWNWVRPDIDPHLMLGWIGAAMVGGALDWRPLVWVTGDKATGKSTLQKMVKMIITDQALITSTDPTEAGIRQAVGRSSLPVALDELEAEEDNRRANNIVKLARIACSGSQVLRGGADHKGSAFSLMNCFMFSSILIPPMLGQDVSRMAILELKALEDVMAPTLEPDHYKTIGQVFRRRFLNRWKDFGKILALYRQALAAKGHSGRSADQFGTLYACHDLLMYDGIPPQEVIDDVAARLEYCGLAEASEDVADWERCVQHLLSSPLDTYRGGERQCVAEWVKKACGGHDVAEANRALGNYGLRVQQKRLGSGSAWHVLMVANTHRGLNEIFKDTHWCGRSGASGVWVQSLRRVPEAQIGKKPTRFNGVSTRYTEIPVSKIMEKEKGEQYAL